MTTPYQLQNIIIVWLTGLIGSISVQGSISAATLSTIVNDINGGTITISKDTELTSWSFVNNTGVTWTDFHWVFSDSSTNQPILVNVEGTLKSEHDIFFGSTFFPFSVKPGNSFDGVVNPKKWIFLAGDTIIKYSPTFETSSCSSVGNPSGCTSVPEPSSILGTLVFGTFGIGAILKLKLKQKKIR